MVRVIDIIAVCVFAVGTDKSRSRSGVYPIKVGVGVGAWVGTEVNHPRSLIKAGVGVARIKVGV